MEQTWTRATDLSVARKPSFNGWRLARQWLMAMAAVYIAATFVRMYARNYYLFLPDYLRWTFSVAPEPRGPVHLFVAFTDHFEPDGQADLTQRWLDKYAAMARGHADSSGRPPQHTWFYQGERYSPDVLALLRTAVVAGLGEVELHFHHVRDTRESLEERLRKAIGEMQQYGFLKTVDGLTRFGFVHGNFALDNSDGPGWCGVNTEIDLLRQLGAFA